MANAQWIWLDDSGKKDEFVAFYDEFTVTDGAISARISCCGDYTLYVNGEFIACGQYPDYSNYKIYDEINLAPFVRSGKNEFKIVAWHYGEDFSTHREEGAGLWYEVLQNGKALCFSREGTECALAPDYVSYSERKITVQLGYSYTYDMRALGAKPICRGAVKVSGFGNELYPRPVKKLSIEPTSLGVCIDEKKRLYDLGRERCGFLHIRFKAREGTQIRVAYGEHVADGHVRCDIDGRDFSVRLIASGGDDEFLGTFRRLGGRYLQVICEEYVSVEFIGVAETPYPLVKRAFSAGNILRRRIYDTCVRTLELCMHEHYEDTPWREQSMYIMDSRNQMLCGYYAFCNPEFQAATLRLMLLGQKENGLFELCFPSRVNITIPYFSLMITTALKEYYEHTADKNLLGEALPRIEKMYGFFEARSDENGLFKTVSEEGIWHFYDWAGSLDGAFFSLDGGKKRRDEYDCIINAHLSLSYSASAAICRALGKENKATEYEKRKAALNAKIFETFFDEEKKIFRTSDRAGEYSELANALAVLCGACPQNKRAAIAEKLARDDTDWVKCTLSMNTFKYDALLLCDFCKYKQVVLKDIDDAYGKMLLSGATSFWETKKGEADFAGAGSLCHGWSAIPVYYYRICKD